MFGAILILRPQDELLDFRDRTEADPMAILIQFLVALGNVVGHNPNFQVEATRHHLNLFATLVGATSKARKGTSWGRSTGFLALQKGRLQQLGGRTASHQVFRAANGS